MTETRIAVLRFSERPELWNDTAAISEEVWPEYNVHGDVLGRHWDRLFDEFPEFQFALYDEDRGEVLAEGHTAPYSWDGTLPGLGEGLDQAIVTALDGRDSGHRPTALCAMAAEIRPSFQGRGLARRILEAMADMARQAGLTNLIAPVRPSLKERYPITPIERYVLWRRGDGQPFDPWIRTHTRMGGALIKPLPQSMRITGRVAEWEQWTGMSFPDDGDYTFPRGLAPVSVDHRRDLGAYWEPNVWIVHRV